MGFLKREKTAALSVQTREKQVYALNIHSGETGLYRALRESIPIIDAAVAKLRRLIGGFRVEAYDSRAQKELESFLSGVKVGSSGAGIDAFIGSYIEELLTMGTAVGEIVMGGGDIAALYNAPLSAVSFREKNPLETEICTVKNGETVPCPYPELICFTALNPKPGEICGESLLKGLPFVSDILLKIYSCMGSNWDRLGNVRFAVSCKQDGMGYAPERARQIAGEWQRAMRGGEVNDFISIGDVSIKAIGSDVRIPDSEIPVRQMLEQIVAKTGLPPFLLGLSWSSTERMSSQQADILTSELEAYRRLLEPVISKIVSFWLMLKGFEGGFDIIWDDITMQDEVDHANARYLSARAREIEEKLEGGKSN